MLSLQMRARFADEHLARWTPIFSKSLQERDKTGYYANWAKGWRHVSSS